MKTISKSSILVAVFLICSVAFSADAPGWVEGTHISKVSVQPNGNVYITLESAVPNLGCANHSGGILQLDTNAPNFDEQYSLILSAFMAGKIVNVYVSGCGNAYPYAQNTNVSR